jgi:hypothetical protein
MVAMDGHIWLKSIKLASVKIKNMALFSFGWYYLLTNEFSRNSRRGSGSLGSFELGYILVGSDNFNQIKT